jgi:predicted Zn-dependent peptidase
MWGEIESIREQGVAPEELARVKKLLKSQFIRVLANNFYRGLLSSLLLLKTGDPQHANRLLDLYAEVTPLQVQEAARRYLSPDNRTVVLIQPVSQEENASLGEVA